MKLDADLLKMVGLVLLSAACSGCMTTKAVTDIGKRTEMLDRVPDAGSVIVAEDGSIALKVRSRVIADRSLVCECDKYLVTSRSAIESCISNTAVGRDIRSPRQRMFPGVASQPSVRIWANCGDTMWDVVPNGISNENMTLEKLPSSFRKNTTSFRQGQPIPYVMKDKNINLQVYPTAVMQREHRVWWGYPAQVLVPPAFMLDLLCCPLCLATVGENNEFIHYEPPWKAF